MDLDSKIFTDIQGDDILKELQLEYDVFDLITINEFTVKEQIEKNPFYQEQFRLLFLKEKGKLMRLELLRDEYIGKLYDELKYKSDLNLTKTEIEKYYIPKDDMVIKMRKLELKTEIRMGFFDAVWESFKQQGWQTKMWIEVNK